MQISERNRLIKKIRMGYELHEHGRQAKMTSKPRFDLTARLYELHLLRDSAIRRHDTLLVAVLSRAIDRIELPPELVKLGKRGHQEKPK